jgi:hypothetical protein
VGIEAGQQRTPLLCQLNSDELGHNQAAECAPGIFRDGDIASANDKTRLLDASQRVLEVVNEFGIDDEADLERTLILGM